MIGLAVEEAGLAPGRVDEERAGGIIHKPMFERVILFRQRDAHSTRLKERLAAACDAPEPVGARNSVAGSCGVLVLVDESVAAGSRITFAVGGGVAAGVVGRGDGARPEPWSEHDTTGFQHPHRQLRALTAELETLGLEIYERDQHPT